jgi:hypothetical protein
MTSIVMMYVYFDRAGDIKAIAPAPDPQFEGTFSSTTFQLTELEGFLTGKKNPSEYQIKKTVNLAGESHKLLKKVVSESHVRTLDNYLTKIDEKKKGLSLIRIVNDIQKKEFMIEATRDLIEMSNTDDEDYRDMLSDFLVNGHSTIYITKRNNPYSLLFSISFLPSELINQEKLYFPYDEMYTNTSAYTKKLITGYTYRERLPK